MLQVLEVRRYSEANLAVSHGTGASVLPCPVSAVPTTHESVRVEFNGKAPDQLGPSNEMLGQRGLLQVGAKVQLPVLGRHGPIRYLHAGI